MPDNPQKPDALPTQGCSRNAFITGVVSYHAGLRRVDGVGYQTQLAPGGHVILISITASSPIVALILWHYTRNRNLMDVTNSDFPNFT